MAAGRPKKILTAKQVRELEKLAAVMSLDQIADFFGMSDQTIRRRMAEDPLILEAYKKGRAKAIAGVGKGLLQMALDGNLTSIIFYLKTQAGWRETDKVEHTGTVKMEINEITLVYPEESDDGDEGDPGEG